MPVAPAHADVEVPEADDVIVLEQPERFAAVGEFYERFEQTDDAEVEQLLRAASRR